jgi:thymidylate synthase (FAD)
MSFGNKQSPKDNAEYIRHLIHQGHESVLEHASWTFLSVGVSRAFTHQLVRHRIGFSFSQLSQQYVDQSDVSFIGPLDEDLPPEVYEQWTEFNRRAVELYKTLIETSTRSDGPEDVRAKRTWARSVLPNSAATTVVFSANARALRHFLAVRGSTIGDLEMREFSAELLTRLREEAPAAFFDFEVREEADGFRRVVQLERARLADQPT